MSPITTEGRVIAALLTVTGIGVIGVFTATITSLFFEQGKENEIVRLELRLRRLEEKVDRLLLQENPRGRA